MELPGTEAKNEISHPTPPHSALAEVFWLFLRLGFTAFGGPAAHISMMREEVVQRRHWISDQRFVDLMGATNLIPSPSSTELAIYLGYAPPLKLLTSTSASRSARRSVPLAILLDCPERTVLLK